MLGQEDPKGGWQPSGEITESPMEGLRNAIRALICEALRDYDPYISSGLTLPGLSLRSQEESDPLHAVLLDGIISGLRTFLLENTSGSDLCRGFSDKEILDQFGMTDHWRTDDTDLFRKRLYKRMQELVREAINRCRPIARKSEVEHALKEALRDYGPYFARGEPLPFDEVIGIVDNKLRDRRATSEVLVSVCRQMGFFVKDGKLLVSRTILNAIQPDTRAIQITNAKQVVFGGDEQMKIGKIEVQKTGQTIIAEKIANLEYAPQFGISQNEFVALVKQVTALAPCVASDGIGHSQVAC